MDQLQVDPATGQKADGFLWGVPRDVSTFALYLNLDLIDAAGAEDPRELAANGEWTWDKFAEVSQQIAENVEGAKGFGAGGWWANWGYFVNSGGGSFFNADRTACALDTPEAIAGMEFYQNLYASGSGVPFGEDAEPPFKAGTLGMFINGRWATPGSREITVVQLGRRAAAHGRGSRQGLAVLGRLRGERQHGEPRGGMEARRGADQHRGAGQDRRSSARTSRRGPRRRRSTRSSPTRPRRTTRLSWTGSERSGRRGSAVDGQLAGFRQGGGDEVTALMTGDHDRGLPEEHLQGHRGGLGVALPAGCGSGTDPGPHPPPIPSRTRPTRCRPGHTCPGWIAVPNRSNKERNSSCVNAVPLPSG